MVIYGIVIGDFIERWTTVAANKIRCCYVVSSRTVVGIAEMHGGAKKHGHDQLMCAFFKKVVTHARCYVEVRNDKSMRR